MTTAQEQYAEEYAIATQVARGYARRNRNVPPYIEFEELLGPVFLSAVAAGRRQNPDLAVDARQERMDEHGIAGLMNGCDLLIDASDNYGTRLSINRACRAATVRWVMGSCIRMEGQLAAFDPSDPDRACYRCVYGEAPDQLEDCPGAGISRG